MAVATNIMTWVATLDDGTAKAAGASHTVTVHLTAGWEIQIPFRCVYGTYSVDSGVFVYRSNDGGTTYDSLPFTAFSITGGHLLNNRRSIILTTGQYAIQMRASSPTCTFIVATQAVITGINVA